MPEIPLPLQQRKAELRAGIDEGPINKRMKFQTPLNAVSPLFKDLHTQLKLPFHLAVSAQFRTAASKKHFQFGSAF